MESVLDKEMYNYFTRLNEAEKKSVVQMLKTFLKSRENNPGRTSIEQYNQEIDEAIARVESGDFYTQEEIEDISKNW